jgi:hypothetical protein
LKFPNIKQIFSINKRSFGLLAGVFGTKAYMARRAGQATSPAKAAAARANGAKGGKPDMRHLEYRSGDNVLKIRPSGLGLPTIFDKDILIFTISQMMARKNRGEPIGDTVRFSARDLGIPL